jgi:hypothetical protein
LTLHDEPTVEGTDGGLHGRGKLFAIGIEDIGADLRDDTLDEFTTAKDLDFGVDDRVPVTADDRLAAAHRGPVDRLSSELDQDHGRGLVHRRHSQRQGNRRGYGEHEYGPDQDPVPEDDSEQIGKRDRIVQALPPGRALCSGGG